MITDKHSQTLIFWCQKSLSPTSNSKIRHLYSSIEQSDLSSLNSLNKNEHYKSAFQKKNIQSGHHLTKTHSENFANVKSPFKNQRFCRSWEILSHTFSDFPLEETRHVSPNLDRERSAKYRYSSNMAEHDSSHISSLTIPDQATKGQTPTLNLPSSQNTSLISTFFQIWRYSFWRFFSVGDSDCRRFDRTFREIRLTSRPEIRSDSGSDGPLTALTTPMI
jgi:hypothetical protein